MFLIVTHELLKRNYTILKQRYSNEISNKTFLSYLKLFKIIFLILKHKLLIYSKLQQT